MLNVDFEDPRFFVARKRICVIYPNQSFFTIDELCQSLE